MGLLNGIKAIVNEGTDTFADMLKEKRDDHKSESDRYTEYIADTEPKQKLSINNCETVKTDVISVDREVTSVVLEVLRDSLMRTDADYVVLKNSNVELKSDIKDEIGSIILIRQRCDRSTDVVYWDHDELKNGVRCNPVFKPDFSPDTLLSYDYIKMWAARKVLVINAIDQLGKIIQRNGIDSCKDQEFMYGLILCIVTIPDVKVAHIRHILAHMNADGGIPDRKSIRLFKKEILDIDIDIISGREEEYILYPYNNELVSIIIPSKDNPEVFKICVQSIKKYTMYSEYEIILVDNGSSQDNKEKYKEILKNLNVRTTYIYKPMEFNFSCMCNTGADSAKGELLLFLNDDIEITNSTFHNNRIDWLGVMAGQALQTGCGAVGTKLLYPSTDKIQHIGVINYEYAGLAHLYPRVQDNREIKDLRNIAVYNYLAVTGACLMVEKNKYMQIDGFSDKLAVTHNDIDLCMKLYEHGYFQVQRNDIVMYHHESLSRGLDVSEESSRKNMLERDILYGFHPDLERYDPFYSPNRDQKRLDYGINTQVFSNIYEQAIRITDDKHIDKIMQQMDKDRNEIGVRVQITSVKITEGYEIIGYAYSEKKKKAIKNPTIVIYNDKDLYIVSSKSLCDRVFHKRKNLKYHINFAPFFCGVNVLSLNPGKYNFGVILN